MRTVREWFEVLPANLKERALRNAKNKLNDIHPSFIRAIYRAFIWVDSKEGHSFWSEVDDFALDCENKDIELTPELDWPHSKKSLGYATIGNMFSEESLSHGVSRTDDSDLALKKRYVKFLELLNFTLKTNPYAINECIVLVTKELKEISE